MYNCLNNFIYPQTSDNKVLSYFSVHQRCLLRWGWCKYHRCCQRGEEEVPRTHASFFQPGEDYAPHAAEDSASWLPPWGQRAVRNLSYPSVRWRKCPGVTLQQQRGGGAGGNLVWVYFSQYFAMELIDIKEIRCQVTVGFITSLLIIWQYVRDAHFF